MADYLSSLPLEIWLRITHSLNISELEQLAATNWIAHSVCTSEEMYRDLLVVHFFSSAKRLSQWNSASSMSLTYKEAYFAASKRISDWCKEFSTKHPHSDTTNLHLMVRVFTQYSLSQKDPFAGRNITCLAIAISVEVFEEKDQIGPRDRSEVCKKKFAELKESLVQLFSYFCPQVK